MPHATIETEALRDVVKKLKRFTPRRSTLPILAYFRVDPVVGEGTDGDAVQIAATDLDSWASMKVPAEVSGELGAFTIARSDLESVLKYETADALRFRPEGSQLSIEGGAFAVLRVETFPPDEFPAWPEVPHHVLLRAPAEDLAFALTRTVWSTSVDESRPILAGVHLEAVMPRTLGLTATNGHQMASLQFDCPDWDVRSDLKAIIGGSTLSALRAGLFDNEDPAELFLSGELDNNAHVKQQFFRIATADREVVARLVQGPYPNYRQVIPPREDLGSLTVDREQLLAAIQRAKLFASPQTHRLKIIVQDHQLEIRTKLPGCSRTIERVPVADLETWIDETTPIGFNGAYLESIVRRMHSPRIRIWGSRPDRACVFEETEVEEQAGGSVDATYLLMPLRLVD